MKVIKRNGKSVSFNPRKIKNAIRKAGFVSDEDLNKIVDVINEQVERRESMTIEDIQDLVEFMLMKTGNEQVAREYIRYRKTRELIRQSEATNESILKLIDDKNEYLKTENSNKNHAVASTQRDYIAGEVSKDISTRLILSKDIVEAHKKGAIHAHDLDYMLQHIFNCFGSKTRFVTDKGVIAFKDCKDGQVVNVLTKDGRWAPATVRMYGQRNMQYVTIQSGRTTRVVKCTPDHRWILKDGSVTTNLKAGDHLWCLQKFDEPEITPNEFFCWGLILADGNDQFTKQDAHFLRIRLCGHKTKYIKNFLDNGYTLSTMVFENGDVILTKKTKMTKKGFLESRAWELLSADDRRQLFEGYYAGDGSDKWNTATTTNPYILEMIRDISCCSGRHVTAVDHVVRDTNFKKGSEMDTIRFMKSQPNNRNWIVKKIEPTCGMYDAWCVEEPSTHSFTLEGGVVTGNCCLVDLEDIFQGGTVINGTMIERPHSFATACNIATQIAAIVASNQYGGQTMSYSHLAPFVDVSRKRIRKELIDDLGDYIDVETLEKNVEKRVRDEVARGVQTIQYQILTLNSSNGQTPFITMFMYLGEAKNEQEKNDLAMIIEEVLKQRMRGVKNETGQWITPAFPKLIYVLEPSNITEDAPYWYLTELAAKCTSKRLVPDYISEKKMLEFKGACFPCMGCRSFLSPWCSQVTVKNSDVLNIVNGEKATVSQLWANLTNDNEGTIEPTDVFVDHKIVSGKIKRHKVKSITKTGNTVTAELESGLIFYGRFNQGVATINLPFAALEAVREVTGSSDFVPQDIQSQKDVLIETFWKKLERYAELCHKVLQTRHARLLNTGVEISPLHWMHGGLARLPKHGNFNELLVGGYSTASLGYAGLYEAVYALIGQTHTSGEGKKFALQILQKLNDYCDKWKKREDIGYSLYGSPIESTTYKFAQANQREFGTIEEVTDHGYVTNSYHVNVRECIDPFTKLDLESEFQALSQGGCISYIETANLQNNIPAVLDVIKHIYDHIMYAELNCKSDYCQVCGSSDEIQIVEKDGKHIWRCRHCGNEDQTKMNVARRTCGYIGSNFWNEGRTQEIAERYVHLGETETLKL